MELGICQGGSLVLLDNLFKPQRIIDLDIKRQSILEFDGYIQASAKYIKMYNNSSQDDEALLRSVIKNDLNGKLNLVMEDASVIPPFLVDLKNRGFVLLQL